MAEIYVNGALVEYLGVDELRKALRREHRRATRQALQESHTKLRRLTGKRMNSMVREVGPLANLPHIADPSAP